VDSFNVLEELNQGYIERRHFDGSTITAPFIGLTQACQQIRAEFRPLYMTSFLKRLRLCDIHSYYATYHLGDYTMADKIDLDTTELTTGDTEPVNLLALFRFISNHPIVHSDMDISTMNSWGPSYANLTQFLAWWIRRSRRADFKFATEKLLSVDLYVSTKDIIVIVQSDSGYETQMQTREEFEASLCFGLGFSNPRFWPWAFTIKYE
jgi:hypothetical protein